MLDKHADQYVGALSPAFPDAQFVPCKSYADLPMAIETHAPQVALTFKVGTDPFPRNMFFENECFRWIHAGGAGIDHLRPWPDTIKVTNSSGIHGDIMAEYILAAIIGFNHNWRLFEQQQIKKHWQKYESKTIAQQTLVIVGLGSIGMHAAKLAMSVGMKIIGVRSKSGSSEEAMRVVGKDQLNWAMAQADHVAICLPLTEETQGMIDGSVLAHLKPGAHFINVARGGIVDEAALLEFLSAEQIAGATLDVFAKEPLPQDSPFWTIPNVRLTPHSSSDIVGWQQRVIDLFQDNLERWLRYEPLRNVVQSARGY